MMFLKYCWPNVLARSPLLRSADVAVYLNPANAGKRKEAMDVLKDTFAEQDLTVYVREATKFPGLSTKKREAAWKQTGSHAALRDAVQFGWFGGYDWVIRVNPDVLIRDDSFISSMEDPSVLALLFPCSFHGDKTNGFKAHTDFFVIKPQVLSDEFPAALIRANAEMTFSRSLQASVFAKNAHRWINMAHPAFRKSPICRAGYGYDFYDSPVIHEHVMHPDICSVPGADAEAVSEVFTDPWPQFWSPPPGREERSLT